MGLEIKKNLDYEIENFFAERPSQEHLHRNLKIKKNLDYEIEKLEAVSLASPSSPISLENQKETSITRLKTQVQGPKTPHHRLQVSLKSKRTSITRLKTSIDSKQKQPKRSTSLKSKRNLDYEIENRLTLMSITQSPRVFLKSKEPRFTRLKT